MDDDENIKEKSLSEIYFFYLPDCSYSKMARAYVSQTYPDLKIRYIDLTTKESEKWYASALNEYHLSGTVKTPLICIGNYCSQGWNEDKMRAFDSYARAYLKTSN